MSHTHFLYHIVFATKDHMPFIRAAWELELYGYLAGIVRNCGGIVLEINGMPEHVHLLIRLGADIKFSDFMRELKAGSSRWVRQGLEPKFSWQRRYGGLQSANQQPVRSASISATKRNTIANKPSRTNTKVC